MSAEFNNTELSKKIHEKETKNPIPDDSGSLQTALPSQLSEPSAAETKDEKEEIIEDDADILYALGKLHVAGNPSLREVKDHAKAKAISYFQKAAEQGHIESQFWLATCLIYGKDAAQNPEEAQQWRYRASEQGACETSGDFSEDDWDSTNLLVLPALRGHMLDQCELGLCFSRKGDYKQAAYWFKAAAEQGLVRAQIWLAECLEEEGVTKNPVEAANWYQTAAAQVYSYGWHAAHGTGGFLKDSYAAVDSFQYGAELRKAAARNRGIDLANSNTLEEEEQMQTAMWYERAVGGDASAQYELALRYTQDKGIAKNKIETWYQKNARVGFISKFIWNKYYKNRDDAEHIGRAAALREAALWFKAAAEQGHLEAQIRFANCLAQGKGITQNPVEAANWYQAAAARLYRSGWHHAHGTGGTARNEREAMACFQQGARLRKEAAENKGIILIRSTTLNEEEQMQTAMWYERAVRADIMAQYELAWRYAQGVGIAQNKAEAIKWYQRAAEGGNVNAKFTLGEDYENAGNIEQAVALYQAAAELGHAKAQFALGCYFANKKNYKEAVNWYQKAANNGNADAQCNLGICYAEGRGVKKKDDKEAVKWYAKAAGRGHVSAQFNLARHCEKGLGIRRDPKEAAKWYKEAMKQGDMDALYNLARLYLDGDGVSYKPEKAMYLFQEAAKQGHKKAYDALAKLLDKEPVLSRSAIRSNTPLTADAPVITPSTPAIAHKSNYIPIASGSAATAGAGIAGLATIEQDAKHNGNRRVSTESEQTFLSSSTSLSSQCR